MSPYEIFDVIWNDFIVTIRIACPDGLRSFQFSADNLMYLSNLGKETFFQPHESGNAENQTNVAIEESPCKE